MPVKQCCPAAHALFLHHVPKPAWLWLESKVEEGCCEGRGGGPFFQRPGQQGRSFWRVFHVQQCAAAWRLLWQPVPRSTGCVQGGHLFWRWLRDVSHILLHDTERAVVR